MSEAPSVSQRCRIRTSANGFRYRADAGCALPGNTRVRWMRVAVLGALFNAWIWPQQANAQAPAATEQPGGPAPEVPVVAPNTAQLPAVPAASIASAAADVQPPPEPSSSPPPQTALQPAAAAPPVLPSAPPSSAWNWATLKPPPRREPSSQPIVEQTTEVSSAWRESIFEWSHVATATALGLGGEYQSSAYQIYEQGFTLNLSYYAVDRRDFGILLVAVPGLDVELTNSDSTTTRREPVLRDLPLAVALAVPVYVRPRQLLATRLRGALNLIAPTSQEARAAGHYVTASPRLALIQALPLRGGKRGILDDLQLRVLARYDHLFSRATTPLDTDLDIMRQDMSGHAQQSDVLDGSRIAPNSVRLDAQAIAMESLFGLPFEVQLGVRYTSGILYAVNHKPVTIATGPIAVQSNPDAPSVRQRLGVLASLALEATDSVEIGVGYESMADLNGPSNNPLYTPRALLTAAVTLKLAELFASHPQAATPAQVGRLAGTIRQ